MAETVHRPYPAPEPNVETKAFWDAAAEGKLLIGRCRTTGQHFYYPRAVSPFALNGEVDFVEAKGTGTLYSYSTMRRGENTPYVLAYVTLDEGPAVLTNIVDCDPDQIKIGDRMRVKFIETKGPPVPGFTPDNG